MPGSQDTLEKLERNWTARQPEYEQKLWGIVIDRIENGLIKDTRIIMDTLGLMTQLGALPSSPMP